MWSSIIPISSPAWFFCVLQYLPFLVIANLSFWSHATGGYQYLRPCVLSFSRLDPDLVLTMTRRSYNIPPTSHLRCFQPLVGCLSISNYPADTIFKNHNLLSSLVVSSDAFNRQYPTDHSQMSTEQYRALRGKVQHEIQRLQSSLSQAGTRINTESDELWWSDIQIDHDNPPSRFFQL